MSGGGEKGWFNLNASGIGTRGFNACTGSASAGCFITEPENDKDGYRNLAGTLRAGYRFDNRLEVDAHLLHSAGETQFDGSFINRSKVIQQTFGGSIRYSPFAFWHLNMTGGRSFEKLDSFNRNIFVSQFDTVRDSLFLQNNFSINQQHILTAGVDYLNDQIRSTIDFTETSRKNWGIFAQHQAAIAAHNMQFSLRWDHNEQFGNWLTGGLSWGYAITQFLRLMQILLANRHRHSMVYFPGSNNPQLRPEESRSFEIGITGSTRLGNYRSMYMKRISNSLLLMPQLLRQLILARHVSRAGSVFSTQLIGWSFVANLPLLNQKRYFK